MSRLRIQPCPTAITATAPVGDEVHVWVVPLDAPPVGVGDLFADLIPTERERAERYRAVKVREQFVVGRGLLRRILAATLDLHPHEVPISYPDGGKPVLDGHPLHFNLTHTDGLALIATATRRVGIDVERVRHVPDADGLVSRFFSPAECAAFRALPEERRAGGFLRGWTCKEAVIKAAGASVQTLDGFDVELDPERPPRVLAVRHAAFAGCAWAVESWEPAPGFTAAIAVSLNDE
ncbi:MAG TPA: 4'-phosphopantetheinyl transferase superfamily protein [Gemmataceae bacterium]|nr:4'-phosphopantetheinyl transferase superfamily protein [Gemmataceae bacterium]